MIVAALLYTASLVLDPIGGALSTVAGLSAQLPAGLATYVGTPYAGGHNLSGGQWQKLALGRAMRSSSPSRRLATTEARPSAAEPTTGNDPSSYTDHRYPKSALHRVNRICLP